MTVITLQYDDAMRMQEDCELAHDEMSYMHVYIHEEKEKRQNEQTRLV